MKFKVKVLGIEAGRKLIVIMDDKDASLLGVRTSDRVQVTYKDKSVIAIVNIATRFPRNTIGVFDEVQSGLGVRSGDEVDLFPVKRPESLTYIHDKILGYGLNSQEIRAIVRDVVDQQLSDIELASFVTTLHVRGTDMNEIEALSRAMVETGQILEWENHPILDKHSIGGVPGDKTTILVVPIVAAAGFTIPKTSSRAITSPAGTADRVESLCPVDLSLEEIRDVVKKTKACLAWGGTLDLAPADDLFIQVEYPLSIDPLLLPSIMSKKKAIGADFVVIDLPTGRGSKIKTIGEAQHLARNFIELGERLGIKVECAVTFGEQPIGFAVGPALEAREALQALMGKGPVDLQDKAINLASMLLEMSGVECSRDEATRILRTGKAEAKLREIISSQGGNPRIKPEDIKVGDKVAKVVSNHDGKVLWINNNDIVQIAREAGAPKEKGAGVLLKVKIGNEVVKGDVLFEIYAERSQKLESAFALAENLKPIGVGQRYDVMIMSRIPAKAQHERAFILER
ncbi:MAG: AMP phosphorylase [archaeon]|nr:AMP phosphorylase [archaeon]MCP8315065.1 AMP phosphorylase [archaeon]